MNDLPTFGALAALIIGGFGLFAFTFQRLEGRFERVDTELKGLIRDLDGRVDNRMNRLETELKELRRDLAEEFRAQRAEVVQQVSAITNAIIAAKGI